MPFDCAFGEGAHEISLQDQEQHHDWHAHDEGGGHQARPVRRVFREEALEANRQSRQLVLAFRKVSA